MNIYKKQQGAVLLIAIILLLVITIVGVSSVSISGIKVQVAGNSMFTMLTYQGAESALAKSVSGSAQENLKKAQKAGVGNPSKVDSSYFNAPSEVVSGGVTLSQEATVTSLGKQACPIASLASSVGTCYVFETNAQAFLNSTGARAHHVEGRAAGLTF